MNALVAAVWILLMPGGPGGPPLQLQGSATDLQVGGNTETIAVIQVHGNRVTPDDEVVRLAGIAVGQPFLVSTLGDVARRLSDAGRFERVDVRRRFASLADPAAIAVVIVVDEGPVRLVRPEDATLPVRVVRRRGPANVMVLPVLDAEDGYGLTYGARVSLVGVTGARGRVSFPLTWGGHRQVGVEFDRPLAAGPLSRVQIGAALAETRNPRFGVDDRRHRAWARIERAAGPVRAGATAAWQRVSFDGWEDEFRSTGVDVAVDTRHDPVLPRNAFLVSVAGTWLEGHSTGRFHRTRVEGRGYVGIGGQNVLAVSAIRDGASRAVPAAFQPLLGGSANLRGFPAGRAAGDTLVAATVEVRVPLTSPLRLGRAGVTAFVDAGTVYAAGERFADQSISTGAGGGLWFTAAAFEMNVSVAHGRGAGTRAHFTAGWSH